MYHTNGIIISCKTRTIRLKIMIKAGMPNEAVFLKYAIKNVRLKIKFSSGAISIPSTTTKPITV